MTTVVGMRHRPESRGGVDLVELPPSVDADEVSSAAASRSLPRTVDVDSGEAPRVAGRGADAEEACDGRDAAAVDVGRGPELAAGAAVLGDGGGKR